MIRESMLINEFKECCNIQNEIESLVDDDTIADQVSERSNVESSYIEAQSKLRSVMDRMKILLSSATSDMNTMSPICPFKKNSVLIVLDRSIWFVRVQERDVDTVQYNIIHCCMDLTEWFQKLTLNR